MGHEHDGQPDASASDTLILSWTSGDLPAGDRPATHRTARDSEARRFEPLELLGRGGTAEVMRVRDPALGRQMALKLLRADVHDSVNRDRFLAEARITAWLDHPGVVPVHELGELPDGRPYFTMKEVQGQTFKVMIRDVHAASGPDAWSPAPSGWTLRRLTERCEALQARAASSTLSTAPARPSPTHTAAA